MKAVPLIATIALASASPLANAIELAKIRLGTTPARTIALDPTLPGKAAFGECKSFAFALDQKFKQAHIPSQVIGFEYETAGSRPGRRAHAVVIYEDAGRTYIMDNQMSHPVWVQNAGSLRDKIDQYAELSTLVLSAWELNDGSAQAHRLAHKGKAPRITRPSLAKAD